MPCNCKHASLAFPTTDVALIPRDRCRDGSAGLSLSASNGPVETKYCSYCYWAVLE